MTQNVHTLLLHGSTVEKVGKKGPGSETGIFPLFYLCFSFHRPKIPT